MNWARWQGAVSVALFGVSAALGQGSDAWHTGSGCPENTVTVREPGKPDAKCRIVRCRRQPNGMMAYDVQIIDSGEWMTVVETGAITAMSEAGNGTCIRGVSSQIYHWGRKPPTGIDSPSQEAGGKATVNDRGAGQACATSLCGVAALMACPGRSEALGTSLTNAPSDWRQSWGGGNGCSARVDCNARSCQPSTVSAPMVRQVGYTTDGSFANVAPPNAVCAAAAPPPPMPAEVTEAPPEHHGPIMRMVRKLTGKDNAEMVVQDVPEAPPVGPRGPSDFDLGGVGAKSVLAAGQGLDRMQFQVPGPVMPMPSTPPPLPPGYVPYSPRMPQGGYYPGMQGMMPSMATVQPGMGNAFSAPPAPPMPPGEANAFYVPEEEKGPTEMVADAGSSGSFLGRLFHRPSAQATTSEESTGRMPAQGQMEDPAMAAAVQTAPGASITLPAPGHFVQQAAMSPASGVRRGPEVSGDPQGSMATLRNSLMPSEREMAAESLGSTDARANPAVVSELLRSARQDPAASVRCACVRSLVKMNVNSGVAMATLQGLKSDSDPQVRATAQEALAAVASQPAPMQDVQQAGFRTSMPAR